MTWTIEQAAHHFPVGSVDGWRDHAEPNHYDPIATLAYLAGCTSHVRLGTAVLVLPARNPVVLAKQAASLDELSGGRLTLGVGVGGTVFADADFAAVGAQELRRHRGRVMDEWIDVLKQAWLQPMFSYRGRYIEIEDASIFPKPMQEGGPPVLIGGDSQVALRRAARRGDGSIVSRLEPEQVGQRRNQLARLAKPSGRSGDDFYLAVLRWLSVVDDDRMALARAEKMLGQLRRGGRPVAENVRHLVGTADRLRELVEAYRSSGIDEIIIQVMGDTEAEVLESLERFQTEVLNDADVREHADRDKVRSGR